MQAHHMEGAELDELDTKYHSDYVEAYVHNRTPGQSIEEWTMLEGNQVFIASQIYKPLVVSVAVRGPSNNAFSVDVTRADWHPQFTNAVKSVLVESKLANIGDVVTLADVRGKPISDFTVHQLQQVGVVYPLVNGTRTKVVSVGQMIKTPATHAVNKDELLAKWSADICAKSIEIVANAVSHTKTPEELDQCLFGTNGTVKTAIQKLASNYGGHLPSFDKVVEIHGDPALLEAIRQGRVKHDDIAGEIADNVLDSIQAAYQAHSADVDTFFKNQEAKRVAAAASASIGASFSDAATRGRRTIFGPGSSISPAAAAAAKALPAAIGELVDHAYPTALKLHRDILNKALGNNPLLVSAIGHCCCTSEKVQSHGRRRHRHHNKNPRHMTLADKSRDEMTSAERAFADRMTMPLGAPVIASKYRDMFAEEPERYLDVLQRCNEMACLPPAPGMELIERSSRVPGTWHNKNPHGDGGGQYPRHRSRGAHHHPSHGPGGASKHQHSREENATSAHGDVWSRVLHNNSAVIASSVSTKTTEPPSMEKFSAPAPVAAAAPQSLAGLPDLEAPQAIEGKTRHQHGRTPARHHHHDDEHKHKHHQHKGEGRRYHFNGAGTTGIIEEPVASKVRSTPPPLMNGREVVQPATTMISSLPSLSGLKL